MDERTHMMTGKDYQNLLSSYLDYTYSPYGVKVYTEVFLGRSILGTRRRVDVLAVLKGASACAFEAKYQGVNGTAEQKLFYALKDAAASVVPSYVVYSGDGFGENTKAIVGAHPLAVSFPHEKKTLLSGADTIELDLIMAVEFGLWGKITHGKEAHRWQSMNTGKKKAEVFYQQTEINTEGNKNDK